MKSIDHYAYQFSATWGFRYPSWVNRILSSPDNEITPVISPSGLKQFVHPDLILFQGYRHLALTPYPYSVNRYENPEVYKEDEAGRWHFIASIPAPSSSLHHLSDPDLLDLNGQLCLLYRSCNRSSSGEDRLYLKNLSSGEEHEVLRGPKSSLLSPSAVMLGPSVLLFAVDATGPHSTLIRFQFDQNWALQAREIVPCPIARLWHLDLAWDGAHLAGLFLSQNPTHGHRKSLVCALSNDEGRSFGPAIPIQLPVSLIAEVYRASLLPNNAGYDVALSYQTPEGRWRTTLNTAHIENGSLVLQPRL